MGLDYGTMRIGVALSDPLRITAQPHEVWAAEDPDLLEKVRALAMEREVEAVVVGLPISLAGGETASTAGARALAERVSEVVDVPVHLSDERLSTKTAEEALIAGKVRRKRRKELVDKVAAAVMLQHWLDGR